VLSFGKSVRSTKLHQNIFDDDLGFMKRLPNLVKQDLSSAAALVHILLKMYFDEQPEQQSA